MNPRPATIDDYRWLYAHGYMPDGLKCSQEIMLDIIKRCPATFLDYGCGRGELVRLLSDTIVDSQFYGYDPALDFKGLPFGKCDWLISCDVLEHIPEPDLDALFKQWALITNFGLLLTIANMSDVHTVNGEQVELHLIQKPATWWIDRLRQVWPFADCHHRTINIHRFALIVEF
jgi:hypothetical protein